MKSQNTEFYGDNYSACRLSVNSFLLLVVLWRSVEITVSTSINLFLSLQLFLLIVSNHLSILTSMLLFPCYAFLVLGQKCPCFITC